MPPKVKTTKEDIINATYELVKVGGADRINARSIASHLGCSTQPVFSNFESMEELKLAVVERADEKCDEYINAEIARGVYPEYKASGMAYIRFAKEQKHLFKLLYMRDRTQETTQLNLNGQIKEIVEETTGLLGESAQLFHLEMWTFVHGIATMIATEFSEFDEELISRMITDCYQGLKSRHGV